MWASMGHDRSHIERLVTNRLCGGKIKTYIPYYADGGVWKVVEKLAHRHSSTVATKKGSLSHTNNELGRSFFIRSKIGPSPQFICP